MPISNEDAPAGLPDKAKEIYASAFNSAWGGTCKDSSDRDGCSAKVAWNAVKKGYKKVNGFWTAKAVLVEIELVITKASLHSDGTMRWQGVASDTGQDVAHDRTTMALFRDWIERVDSGAVVDFLPPPRQPFLGVSHYPSLDGFGEAGVVDKMYVDGNRFKVGGRFADTPVGKALFTAIREELDLIKRDEAPDQPIRISAAWWDIQHAHGDFKFTRKNLVDRCPMCADGVERIFLKGQLDHFASTRIPMNTRTSIGLEEKSMPKTRHDDASSIISDDLADELEERAREELIGKSDAEAEPGPALVIKADDTGEPIIVVESANAETQAETTDKGHMGDYPVEEWKPFGGATSLADAADFVEAQELEWKVYDNWAMLRAVMENILDNDEEGFDKLGAVRKAVDEFGDRVAALKANISDAYLVQPIEKGATVMSESQTPADGPTTTIPAENQEPSTPGQAFWDSIEAAAADPTMTREDMVAGAQADLESLATATKNRIDAVRPPDVAEELKSMLDAAIDAKVTPLMERIELLLVKQQVPVTQAPGVPQQRSITSPAQVPQAPPVQKSGLTQMIRRSVGLNN